MRIVSTNGNISDVTVTFGNTGSSPIKKGSSILQLDVHLANVSPTASGNNIPPATGTNVNFDLRVHLSDVDLSVDTDTLGLTPTTLIIQVCQHYMSVYGRSHRLFNVSYYFTW